MLIDGVDDRLKEIIMELATEKNWDVQSMEVMPDHVHMLIAADPKWSASEIMKFVKGRSVYMLRKEFPVLKEIVKKHLWTSSFFVTSVGGTNEDVVKRYIENQKMESE
jgi:putative transposase